jgi:predicted RNA-binding Zn ribbon-like protein
MDLGPAPWRFMPSGRQPAPGGLRIVQAFVNTTNRERDDDALDRAEGFGLWLGDFALGPPEMPIAASDRQRAKELREALRTLLVANTVGGCDLTAAHTTIERVSHAAHLSVRLGEPPQLEPLAPGIDGVLGRLVGIAYTAMADGTWQRLKACRRDVCHWAFYDHSRNRSGAWCSMQYCGNRTKTRSYRRRHR